jgi:hypothetical protein
MTAQFNLDRLLALINTAHRQYYRLVLVLGDFSAPDLVRDAANANGASALNLSLALSRHLVELAPAQRSVAANNFLNNLVRQAAADHNVLYLTNLELLFEPSLKRNLARNATIVAAFNGRTANSQLFYAEQNHPEYQIFPVQGITILEPGNN